MKTAFILLSLALPLCAADIIPDERRTDWTYAGIPGGIDQYIAARTNLINVRDYGATGDGETDDYTAIAAAFGAINESSNVVYFPAGRYVIGTRIYYAYTGGGFSVRGAGTNSVLIVNTGAEGFWFGTGEYPSPSVDTTLTADGERGATNITVADASNFTVGKVIISDEGRDSIYTYLSDKYAIAFTNWGVTYYPTNFANLWGWWDANTLNGTVADGATVATLQDLSGNGRDFTNGAAASQPLFHSNVFNGKSVLGFSNQAAVMKMICKDRFTNAYLQETFMIIVHRFTNVNSALLGNDGSKSAGNYQWRTCEADNKTLLFNGSATLSGAHIVPTNVLRVSVAAFQTNYPVSTSWKGYQWQNLTNNLEWNEGAGGYLFDKIGAVITDAVPAAGEFCELILYNGTFDKDSWAKLYLTYLKPKWGIP